MRTKVLLGLAALAVGLSTSVAQNVYSLNVVGYVNVSLQAGKLHFLSLPLAQANGDYTIGNTIKLDNGDGSQDFSNLYKWDQANQKWDDVVPTWFGGAWDTPSMVISNGFGFFVIPSANSTLTFVGEVPQGAIPYQVPTGLSTLANKVPVSTNFPGSTVGNDFDNIYTWDFPNQKWADAVWTYFSGWDLGAEGPMLAPAEAFFYVNGAAAIPFTRNFTVQ
jgi:hypothetical protein